MSVTSVANRAPSTLAALEEAHALLDRARTVPEVKEIRDKAEALRSYAAIAGYGLEVQNQCAKLKLEAERKAGELLADREKHPGGRPAENQLHDATGSPSSLADLGIERTQSHRWQKLASLDRNIFDDAVASATVEGIELTTASMLRLAKPAANHRPGGSFRPHGDLPEGVFSTIVIDPPWQYDNKATRGAASDHYPTMSVEELCELDVGSRSAPASHLYLWTTNGFMREAFVIMEAWGFTYKTLLTWVKPQIGMGNYFRSCTEHVLFGIKGGLGTERNDLRNWFEAPRGKHSAKPERFYDLVRDASPGPYLEMFARQRRLGWSTWGNES